MGVFFNGRLWISPATMSIVDDSAMYNKNLSVGNTVAILGSSLGGKPGKVYRFGSASEAAAVLIGGDLLKAVEKAFDPSSQTSGPSSVVAIRVGASDQSSYILRNSSSSPVINLTSVMSGSSANRLQVQVSAGAKTHGRKVSIKYGTKYLFQKDIYQEAFSVKYNGAEATADITVNGTDVILSAPTGTVVETIPLSTYATVQDLVNKINAVSDFSATVGFRGAYLPTQNSLDFVANAQCKMAEKMVTATLQSIVNWVNSDVSKYAIAERVEGVGSLPVVMASFASFSGATGVAATTLDWQNSFDELQKEDVQWVAPLSANPAIHAMADTHCAFMSNIARMERRCIVGSASGMADEDAITAAKALNSDRTSYVHIGFYDYDENGALALFPPYILAAMLAGMFSGVNPGTALTNKTIKVRGLERKLRNPTDTDVLIEGGVLCVEETGKGFKVVKSITTWLTNDNYNRVEVSVGVACDFISRNIRNILDDLRGMKANPQSLSMAVERTESALRELARPEPMGPGVLAGDKANPPYRNITASIEGDVLRVEFECSPVIPINYIPVVVHAVPYSGSASA